jgi:hypothetical protein
MLLLGGCRSSVPHRVWINRDVDTRLVSGDGTSGSVLIAAARSDYKERVVSEVVALLEAEAAEVQVVGLRELSDEELQAERYDAILIVNTCMAWMVDPKVARFLDANPGLQERTVLLTTSGDGEWLPDPEERDWQVDAVSSPSKEGVAPEKATELNALLVSHFGH